MAVRIAYDNLLADAGVVIIPSSEESGMPRAALLRPGLSDRLRTKTGWTVLFDENDQIKFAVGAGPDTFATIAAGYYATAALYAAAVVAAMEASDAAPVWACSNDAGTKKFTISADVAFTLKFGDVLAASAHPDLGFASTTTGSAVSHTAGSASYQSRHVLNVDLVSAQAMTAAMVGGHNLTASAVVTFQVHTVSMVGDGYADVTFDFSTAMSGTATRVAFFASISKRYVRLVISDVQNSAGYVELGVFFVGLGATTTVYPSIEFSQMKEHLSGIAYADGGAHHQIRRARRRAWSLKWQLENRAGLAVADRAVFDALDALGIGASFFLCLDDATPTDTMYGFNRAGLSEKFVQGAVWEITMDFAEALG